MKKLWITFLLCIAMLTGCTSLQTENTNTPNAQTEDSSLKEGSSSSDTDASYTENKKKKSSKKSSKNTQELSVHFIDVGQGDSALIMIGSHAMLIDAGDNSMGTTVWRYLQKQGITSLDYVIGTHPDSDHIGGLDVVIYKFNCKKILMPDCSNDTETYRDVIESMKSKGYKAFHPKLHQTFSLGKATFCITGPVDKYEETNDNSISLQLTYQDTSFLFMGDVTSDTEPEILANNKNLQSDVLKVAHHGSKYSTTEEFLEEVSPAYAVISCAKDNKYGFPTAKVLNLLRSSGVKLYRTDEQGSLIAKSDGSKISWSASPNEDWIVGENTTSASQQGVTYIVNTNTDKFHKTTCRFTEDISDKNRMTTAKSKADLVKEGYSPCGYCKP